MAKCIVKAYRSSQPTTSKRDGGHLGILGYGREHRASGGKLQVGSQGWQIEGSHTDPGNRERSASPKACSGSIPFSRDSAAVRYQSRVGCAAGLTIPRALTLLDQKVSMVGGSPTWCLQVLTDLALRCLPRFVTDGGVELAT